jgi:hypothetical protein
VIVLCCAQARQNVAGVVRIRTPWYHGQRHLHTLRGLEATYLPGLSRRPPC